MIREGRADNSFLHVMQTKFLINFKKKNNFLTCFSHYYVKTIYTTLENEIAYLLISLNSFNNIMYSILIH